MCNTFCKRARVCACVYVLVCTCACVRARVLYYGFLSCVTCNTVTCEGRQKFGSYSVHGIKASQYQFQGWPNCPVITKSLILC